MEQNPEDIIILHMCTKNDVYQKSYDVWFLRYWARRREFFIILDHFLPFTSLTTWRIKILKK